MHEVQCNERTVHVDTSCYPNHDNYISCGQVEPVCVAFIYRESAQAIDIVVGDIEDGWKDSFLGSSLKRINCQVESQLAAFLNPTERNLQVLAETLTS